MPDGDPMIRGPLEANRVLKYYTGNSVSPRPVVVTEFCHIEDFQDSHDGTWAKTVDADQMRSIMWVLAANGAAHTGLRFPGAALASPTAPSSPR